MTKSSYFVEAEDQFSVTITDIGRDVSVLRELDAVVRDLHEKGILGDRRLYFYDHTGRLDEILHDGHGNFRGIRL
jgi:hypothetical protein